MCLTHLVSAGACTGGMTCRASSLHPISSGRVEVHLLHVAVQIARRLIELLALPLVHVGPDNVAIGTVKFGIDIHQRLHIVVARGYLLQAAQGITQRAAADDSGLPAASPATSAPKNGFPVPMSRCFAQIGVVVTADDHVHPAGNGLRMDIGRNRNLKAAANLALTERVSRRTANARRRGVVIGTFQNPPVRDYAARAECSLGIFVIGNSCHRLRAKRCLWRDPGPVATCCPRL